MREKINELTEFFMSKDKDIAEISQIKAAIQDAAKSNKAQIAVMKDIIKVVEQQKSLVKQFTKSGRMREQKGLLIKTKFVPKNAKLERKASKKLGKMAGFDTGFKNAMKTLREIVTDKYPQEGTRAGAELELDLEEKVALVGGAPANSQEIMKPKNSIKFFEDVFSKLKMIQEHTVKEVTATQKIHDLALQMRKIYTKTTTTKTRVLRKKGQREISGKDTRKKSKYS